MKCPNCGKEFEPRFTRKYCSPACSYEFMNTKKNFIRKLKTMAEKYGFELSGNIQKIVKAKLVMFGKKEMHRCPCDGNNPDRFCGSELCISDVKTKGKCHCGLFLRKDKE